MWAVAESCVLGIALVLLFSPAAHARVLCDFEEEGPAAKRWVCCGGTFGVQGSIAHEGKKAGLWAAVKGFSHLHLRDLDPAFNSRAEITIWIWAEKPLKSGLYLAVGQNHSNFGVVPIALEAAGWNRTNAALSKMAVKGTVDWDLVALFSLVYTGADDATFVIDDIGLTVKEAPTRGRNPTDAVEVDPKADRFLLSDFERDDDDRYVYFERSSARKTQAPLPVKSGKNSLCWELAGDRPFVHFGAVPRDFTPFKTFKGAFFLDAAEALSIHVLICTTDADNFQDEIRLEPGKWTEASVAIGDMLSMGRPSLSRITSVVFTIPGRKAAKVYFDDLVFLKGEESGGGEGKGGK